MKYKGLYKRKFDHHECTMNYFNYQEDGDICISFSDLPKTVMEEVGNAMIYADYCCDYSISGNELTLVEPVYDFMSQRDYEMAIKEFLNELNYDLITKD